MMVAQALMPIVILALVIANAVNFSRLNPRACVARSYCRSAVRAAAQNVAPERRVRPRVDAHRTAHMRSWVLDTQNAGYALGLPVDVVVVMCGRVRRAVQRGGAPRRRRNTQARFRGLRDRQRANRHVVGSPRLNDAGRRETRRSLRSPGSRLPLLFPQGIRGASSSEIVSIIDPAALRGLSCTTRFSGDV
jgi:hypothetical protein